MIRSALLATVVLSAAACLPLADLRPEAVVPGEDQPELAARGRALMEAAAEAHGGLPAWRDKQTTELVFRDRWRGLSRALNPWPSADIRARIVQRPRTFDSVVTFLDDDAGLAWGIEDNRAWRAEPGGERREVDDADIRFMLPTVQYFVEMPFRLLEAELFRSAGVETVDGVDYEVVYVTWRTIEANREFDQYLVYLDPETGRLAKVAYTVREMLGAAKALAHLDDQREVDGIWVPHEMWIGDVGSAREDWFHVMSIEQLRFDTHARDSLEPLPGTDPLE